MKYMILFRGKYDMLIKSGISSFASCFSFFGDTNSDAVESEGDAFSQSFNET